MTAQRTFDTLISAAELAELQRAGMPLAVFDCSFDLGDTAAGQRAYDAGHIPGARYLHLDADLSGAKTGRNGRHPLPERAALASRLAAAGVGPGTQVVAYDASGGMYAARLWWMLRWLGHGAVAVLDGGLPAWKASGGALQTEAPAAAAPGGFQAGEPLVTLVPLADVQANLGNQQRLVLDARAPDRFRGENETLDPIGGHIPGARNRLFRENLAADGRFKTADQLRAEFATATGGRPAAQVIHQCGSGVTACHNLLAMQVAGLRGAGLYAGSWSEWSAQPGAPVATGAD